MCAAIVRVGAGTWITRPITQMTGIAALIGQQEIDLTISRTIARWRRFNHE